MNVLIFEPDHTGHHFLHIGLLVPPLADLGANVTLATTAMARDTGPYKVFVAPVESRATVDAWVRPLTGSPIDVARRKLADLRTSIERANPDWVCLPYADGLAQSLGAARLALRPTIPRGLEVEGLMMRGSFAYPAESAKRRLFAHASWAAVRLAPLRKVHILDPIVYNAVKARGGAFAERCGLMPEPMDPPPQIEQRPARTRLGLPEDGRYIGCVGLIDRRKGCDLLIHAFAQTRLAPTDRLLLVGAHEKEIKDLLAGPYADLVRAGRIISIDRFVESDELGAALKAMDLVCTPYPRHVGSASIVIRAAAAGRPVVGSRYGWVKWAIERFGLGRTCNVENTDELAAALQAELEQAASFRLTPAAERWVAYHTPKNFAATWTARVRERLGLPPAATQHTWQWVEGGERAGHGS